MSEELNQRDLIHNPEKIGKYDFRNIGSTSLLQLKRAGIIHNKSYTSFEKRKPDAIISIPEVVKSKVKTVLGIVENKSTSQFKTKKQKESALQQGLEVAQILEAKFVVLTDTVDTIWINAYNGEEILDEKGRPVKTLFDPKNSDLEKLIEKIIDSVDENNSQIREPRLKDPTKLAKSIWQDLWMAAGATPENCLYSFVELFIFKYLSDLKVLPIHLSYDNLMNIYNSSNNEDREEEALNYYAGTVRKEIKKLFKASDKDNTTIINGTIFVSKDEDAVKGYGTVFIKILKKFGDEKEGGGELKNIDRDFKSKLFETFLKESISKKNWGQYFTPLKVVRAVAKMAESEIKQGITMCDPACGVGKFLLEPLLINNDIEEFFPVEKGVLKPKIKLVGIDKGFDKEEQKTIILAKANMLIYLSDQIRKNAGITNQFAEVFNDTFELKTKNILGTLRDVNYENQIDLILTNPPYVTTGSSNLKEEISKVQELKDFYKINAMGVEGLFMEWIIRSLKPGGKTFIVVPDGIFNRQNDKNLRQFILDECIIDGIISLPLKTFFTTPKKTYILAFTKKKNKSEKQTEPVFTYLVSEIGESRDIYRFDIEQDDLNNAVNLYNFFKGNKTGFEKINSDRRCKIQPIGKFDPETHWSVERWWTKDEQIELGIVEEDKVVKVEEFGDLINDISETLKEYSELLKEVSEKKKQVKVFKEILLSDKNFFDLFIGKRLVKKDLIHIKGSIPIYSANVKEPISYHTQSNISDFNNNFVIWGIDGNFEYNFIPKSTPFVTTDHCGTIRILTDDILPEYLMIQLENVKHKYGFDRGLRSSLKNMQVVSIEIPFDERNNIDVEKQREIIEKYEYISTLKSKISAYKKQIEELNIEVIDNNKFKEINIQKVLNLQDGFAFPSATYTTNKTDIKLIRIQDVNLKSEPKEVRIPKEYQLKNKEKYWVRVGDYLLSLSGAAGFNLIKWKGEEGYLNQRITKINLKEDFANNLIDDYIEILIADIYQELNALGSGQNNNLSRKNLFGINFKIPINSKGEFDLDAQKEIAEKYRKIEQIKKSISSELDKIATIEIDYE